MYPEQLAGTDCKLGEEVERIRPARDFVGPLQVQRADLLHDSGNVVAGSGQVFDANLRCHRISIFWHDLADRDVWQRTTPLSTMSVSVSPVS